MNVYNINKIFQHVYSTVVLILINFMSFLTCTSLCD